MVNSWLALVGLYSTFIDNSKGKKMKIRRLIVFLLGILLLGGGPALAGPSNKPPIPTKLLPAPPALPVPPIVLSPPTPPKEVLPACRWVWMEEPIMYNSTASTFYGGAPMGMVLEYSGCAIPMVIPGGFYRPASISTTKSWQWICKTNEGGRS